jgi:excisionase family DNA binding protein
MSDQAKLLGVRAVAERCGVSTWTVRQAISRGDLRAVRWGRRVLVEAASLEAFLAAIRQPLPAPLRAV